MLFRALRILDGYSANRFGGTNRSGAYQQRATSEQGAHGGRQSSYNGSVRPAWQPEQQGDWRSKPAPSPQWQRNPSVAWQSGNTSGPNWTPKARKMVQSDNISFKCGDDRRIRARLDTSRQTLSVTVEGENGKYIRYGMTRSTLAQWLAVAGESSPTSLADSEGGIVARLGSVNGDLMVELVDQSKAESLSCSVSAGQAKLFEGFLRWAGEFLV